MKEFFKKIWARIKALFGHQYVQTAITLILCIALCLGVVFGVRKCNKSMSTVSASAATDMSFDIDEYSGLNLLPYPYYQKSGTVNGVYFGVNDDGSIGIDGQAVGGVAVFTLFYNATSLDVFQTGVQYYLSLRYTAHTGGYLQVNYFTANGSTNYLVDVTLDRTNALTASFTLPSSAVGMQIFYGVRVTGNAVLTSVFPMITRDSTINWQPPYRAFYQQGFNQGKQEGYQEGMNTASRGIFQNCKVWIQGSYNNSLVSKHYTPTYTDNGITFENVYQGILSDYGSTFSIMSVSLYFNPNIIIGNIKNFRATGPSFMFGSDTLWGCQLYLPNGSPVSTSARMVLLEGTDNVYGLSFYRLVKPPVGDEYEISQALLNNCSLEFLFLGNSGVTLTELRTVKFWADNSAYYVGYQNGYTAGENSGVAYQNGYTDGYKQGDSDGYDIGYSEGLAKAEKFDFAYAISTVLGAPVQVIQEFLDFELLGVDMLGFVSGLFTLMIIVKIIKMIL